MTPRLPRRLAAFGAAAALALAGGCASATARRDAATIGYTVDGRRHVLHVGIDDLDREVGKLLRNHQLLQAVDQQLTQQQLPALADNGTATADSRLTAFWLTRLVRQRIFDETFATERLRADPSRRSQAEQEEARSVGGPQALDAFDEQFKQVLVDREARFDAVTDALVAAYYHAHRAQLARCPSGKEVSHILLPTPDQARQVMQQLSGGASFAALAERLSTDTGSARQGGSLGCLGATQFVKEFQDAADAAPLDTPVGPVQSQFGFHVVLVTRWRPSPERLRPAILQALGQQSIPQALGLADVRVTIDPRFGVWSDDQFSVSTPKRPNVRDQRGRTTPTAAPHGTPGG